MTPITAEQISAIKSALPSVMENEPMAKHTNFRIGGPARLYFVAADADATIKAVHAAIENRIPWYTFGGGSNMLVADAGYEGLLIQVASRAVNVNGTKVECDAGAVTALVARKSAEAGLTGFEWAVGVPGTIGGAVYGNAGCFGGETKDVVQSVDAHRISDSMRVTYTNPECHFGYRDSRFKHESHVILRAILNLATGDRATALAKINQTNETRKAKQPLGESSAGCLFKNFDFASEDDIKKLRQDSDVPPGMIANHRIAAGWLVDQAGFLGREYGGVKVSDKHGNFVTNTGKGTAEQVVALTSMIKTRIRDTYGIMLEDEVQYVGF